MHRKKCLVIDFDDIDTDTRIQRAAKVLGELWDLTLAVEKKQSHHEYPYEVCAPCRNIQNKYLRRSLFMIYVCFKGIFGPYEIIHCGGLYPLIAGFFIKLFTGKKIIYDAKELYLKDEKGESSYSDNHRFIEKLFISDADFVLAANKERAMRMQKGYSLNRLPHDFLNISDITTEGGALPDNFSFLKEKGEKKYIVYQGRLGTTRSLDHFVHILSHLPVEFNLVVIAEGEGVEVIKDVAAKLGVSDRLIVRGFLSLADLAVVLENCDLGIISYDMKGPNNYYCAPNKLYEYAAISLPFVTTPQHTFVELFKEYPLGIAIDRELWEKRDYEKISNLIVDFCQEKVDDGLFSRFNNEFSWSREQEKLVRELREVF